MDLEFSKNKNKKSVNRKGHVAHAVVVRMGIGNIVNGIVLQRGSCWVLDVSIGFCPIGLVQALGHMTLIPAEMYVWAFGYHMTLICYL